MPPTSTAATLDDRLDPWGFGTCASDEPTVIEVTGLSDDELVEAQAALSGVMARTPDVLPLPPTALVALTKAPNHPPSRAAAAESHPTPRRAPADARHTVAPSTRRGSSPLSRDMVGVFGLFALVILGQAFYIGLSITGEVRASAAPTGEVVLSSHPGGARVTIDGRPHGATPMVVALPAGRHRVEVTGADGVIARVEADVTAGGRWTRHLALGPETGAADHGALRVATPDAGAIVLVDGANAGRTPVMLSSVSAGTHTVRVKFAGGGIAERQVAIVAGETMSLVVDPPAVKASTPTGPASGWVRIDAPFAVQVMERGQLVGSSASERIMVTAGPHVFDLANESLGFRVTVKAIVGAGRTEAIAVDTPRAAVDVNAQPWAEVVVDGRVHGETPLANLLLPIGEHQFVFRHPEFGERTQSVTVRLNGPNRVTADLRR